MDLQEEMEEEARLRDEAVAEFSDSSLTELGKQALSTEALIAQLEGELSDAKKRLEKLLRYAIPDRLAEIGVDEFGFDHEGGRARLKVDVKVVGSLSGAPDEEEAVAYLEANGLAGGVKSVVQVDFTEAEREEAARIMAELAQFGREPHLIRKIHPQTLMAFVRQRLREDPSFDYEKVGARAWVQARFTTR